MIFPFNRPLSGQHRFTENDVIGREIIGEDSFIPVDIDVSPFDNSSSKIKVSFTYKKEDGYTPIFAYVGTEGYWLNF